jgi:CHAT domain-containing protein
MSERHPVLVSLFAVSVARTEQQARTDTPPDSVLAHLRVPHTDLAFVRCRFAQSTALYAPTRKEITATCREAVEAASCLYFACQDQSALLPHPPGFVMADTVVNATERGWAVEYNTLLTADDIKTLDLSRCKLVVLTGDSTYAREMAFEFLRRGARAAVLSLRPTAQTAVAALMRRFFEVLASDAKVDVGEALRQARSRAEHDFEPTAVQWMTPSKTSVAAAAAAGDDPDVPSDSKVRSANAYDIAGFVVLTEQCW